MAACPGNNGWQEIRSRAQSETRACHESHRRAVHPARAGFFRRILIGRTADGGRRGARVTPGRGDHQHDRVLHHHPPAAVGIQMLPSQERFGRPARLSIDDIGRSDRARGSPGTRSLKARVTGRSEAAMACKERSARNEFPAAPLNRPRSFRSISGPCSGGLNSEQDVPCLEVPFGGCRRHSTKCRRTNWPAG
jgi:hypothetical protein